MNLSQKLIFFVLFLFVVAQGPTIRNLQARYDAQQDAIFVTWNSPDQERQDLQYQIQYRIVNRDPPDNKLQYKRVQVIEARLDLPNLKNGDEVEVEVKSELDGGGRGQTLSISIVKQAQTSNNQLESDEENDGQELLPPLNFEATILDPNSVKLEWRPHSGQQPDQVFYVVNIKQLTSNQGSGENLLRQQIKVDATEFLLNNLVPGEKYEMTIRTATSAERTSSTAAIVEITMPNDNEYYEVGNLLIASKFQVDGSGTVNLTWEVPNEMRPKIDGYNVEYRSIRESSWRQLSFNGEQPTTILHDLKSDTEYILKIKTRMKTGVETESGEFRFKTPKVNPNPISKVDVIYSSETNAVRVQWTLQDFVEKAQVIGYDIYISEFRDAPDNQWRYIRVDTNEQSTNIDNLPTSTTYFVKIYVRLRDSQLLKSSILYKFTTLNEYPRATQLYPRSVEIHGPKTFSYKNLSPTETEISWRFADEAASSAQEARIYYTTDTEEEDVNSTVWSHIDVEIDPDQTEQVHRLTDLTSNSVYFIKAVPKLNEQYKLEHAENFSIKTATEEQRVKRKHHRRRSLHHPKSHHHHHKHSHHNETPVEMAHSYLQIQACDPLKVENQCDKNQHCVKLDVKEGWCMDMKLIENIINNSDHFYHGINLKTK